MVVRVNFENFMVLRVNFENFMVLRVNYENFMVLRVNLENFMVLRVNCTWYFVIIIYKKYFPQVNDEVTFPVRDIKSVEGNSAKTNIVRSIGSGLLKRQRTRRWPTRIVGKT